jgi:transcriptional regulator with XRE-family HTH domain
MANEFGAKLRELRQNKGLTCGVWLVTGVDFTYLSKIETGRPGYFLGRDTVSQLML